MNVTPFAPQLPPVAPTGAAVSTGPGAGDPTAAGFAALVAGLLAAKPAPAAPTPALVTPADRPVAEAGTATSVAEPRPDDCSADEPGPSPEDGPDLALFPGLPPLVLSVVPAKVDASARRSAEPVPGHRAMAESVSAADVAGPVDPAPVAPTVAPLHHTGDTGTPPTHAASLTPVVPAVPSAGAETAGAAPAAATNPVTRQVIPEVTRLVSQGNGTHRITMTLRPEALGEVRVTLTVRDGEVRVRLAAGDEAQRALVEGAPELRRVLELAGAGDTRVVVRDLTQPVASSSTSPTTSPSAHPGGEGRGDTAAAGHDRSGPQDQHARTRGGSTARDGLSDGAHALRPDPDRHTRPAGVDLTM